MCAQPLPQDPTAVVRRYVTEIVNHTGLTRLEELVGPGYLFHCPDGDLYGPDGARLHLSELREAFPDLVMELLDTVAEGDRVARRFVLRGTHLGPFVGLPPTGQPVEIPGMAIDRIADGQLVETWITLDVLTLLPVQPPAENG
ncbi:MAG: ester cyclase [Chloroflexota bacterium]|nr:ester cyclase [Chloroflexota bacterium]